jgi:hypothetical protein
MQSYLFSWVASTHVPLGSCYMQQPGKGACFIGSLTFIPATIQVEGGPNKVIESDIYCSGSYFVDETISLSAKVALNSKTMLCSCYLAVDYG